ncbi:hypothetical protein BHE74_00051367, partial [Ensete ventricosum]
MDPFGFLLGSHSDHGRIRLGSDLDWPYAVVPPETSGLRSPVASEGEAFPIWSADQPPVPMRQISVFLLHLLLVLFLQSLSYAALEKERTLALIKPDGICGNFANQIKQVISQSGFVIIHEMMVQLDVRNATLFYSEHSAKSFFPNLVEYMTSGPVVVMVIEKTNAIADWRALIGPTDAGKAKVSHPNRFACSYFTRLGSARVCKLIRVGRGEAGKLGSTPRAPPSRSLQRDPALRPFSRI